TNTSPISQSKKNSSMRPRPDNDVSQKYYPHIRPHRSVSAPWESWSRLLQILESCRWEYLQSSPVRRQTFRPCGNHTSPLRPEDSIPTSFHGRSSHCSSHNT